MTPITRSHTLGKLLVFSRQKCGFKVVLASLCSIESSIHASVNLNLLNLL